MSKKDKFILCINGDREINDYQILLDAIEWFGIKAEEVGLVLCGDAKGADKLGKQWAEANNIQVKLFPADWNNLTAPDALIRTNKFGKQYDARAGFRRNQEMADEGHRILSLQTNGITSGTDDCADKFEKAGKIVYTFGKKEYNSLAKKRNPQSEESVNPDEIPF